MSRKERVEQFQAYVKEHSGEFGTRELVARFSIESGLSSRTVGEYLDIHMRASLVSRERGRISWND